MNVRASPAPNRSMRARPRSPPQPGVRVTRRAGTAGTPCRAARPSSRHDSIRLVIRLGRSRAPQPPAAHPAAAPRTPCHADRVPNEPAQASNFRQAPTAREPAPASSDCAPPTSTETIRAPSWNDPTRSPDRVGASLSVRRSARTATRSGRCPPSVPSELLDSGPIDPAPTASYRQHASAVTTARSLRRERRPRVDRPSVAESAAPCRSRGDTVPPAPRSPPSDRAHQLGSGSPSPRPARKSDKS